MPLSSRSARSRRYRSFSPPVQPFEYRSELLRAWLDARLRRFLRPLSMHWIMSAASTGRNSKRHLPLSRHGPNALPIAPPMGSTSALAFLYRLRQAFPYGLRPNQFLDVSPSIAHTASGMRWRSCSGSAFHELLPRADSWSWLSQELHHHPLTMTDFALAGKLVWVAAHAAD